MSALPPPRFLSKICNSGDLRSRVAALTRPLVFTNGVFDIIHRGHVSYLDQARSLGASLVVGVNDDASVRRLDKGPERPLNGVDDRMAVLAAMSAVDLVVSFAEDTPIELIRIVHPDVLVKGGDWNMDKLAESAVVRSWGGKALSIPFLVERSTTSLVERIRTGPATR
jgi:rfaE bifunctional protein nucleotidyltransferase chain/domain